MNRLIAIAPPGIREVWPRLRAPMASIPAPDGALPEDVYGALLASRAVLFLIEIDGAEVGFLVLRHVDDTDGRRLHIWLLHARSGVDVMTTFSDELDAMARASGANKLTFSTARRGWERVAPRHGFAVREVVYQREVKS